MVNRIDKLSDRPNYEVKEVDEDGGRRQEQEDEKEQDGFEKKWARPTVINLHQVQGEPLRIDKADIVRIEFQSLDLAVDPSLLRVLIVKNDGARIPDAILSLPRRIAFSLNSLALGSTVNVKSLTPDPWLDFIIQRKSGQKGTAAKFEQEVTVSHVFHVESLRERLEKKLRIRDVDTGAWRPEILGIYIFVLVVFIFFVLGWIYLGR